MSPTVLLAGRIKVSVETSGSETASARIGQIPGGSAGYTMSSQHKGERLADKAVIPILGMGALGWATLGPLGAVAILNSDLGTGIRMAGPLAMCSSLALCASKGILVKDGRALERIGPGRPDRPRRLADRAHAHRRPLGSVLRAGTPGGGSCQATELMRTPGPGAHRDPDPPRNTTAGRSGIGWKSLPHSRSQLWVPRGSVLRTRADGHGRTARVRSTEPRGTQHP
jgi:hypothetical protein